MIKINKKGQGLLEVMTAIYIIVTGLLSIMNLVIFNIQIKNLNNNIFIASNLAREGIEIIRNTRDSNWINQYDWDKDLIFDSKENSVDKNNPSTNSFLTSNRFLSLSELGFPISPIGTSWENCISPNYSYNGYESICQLGIVKSNSNPDINVYDYAFYYPSSLVEKTGFYRMIFINEICDSQICDTSSGICNIDESNEYILTGYNEHCPVNTTKIGIDVISRVGWNQNGIMIKIDIEEKIYNWK